MDSDAFVMRPIGFIRSSRAMPHDDFWGNESSRIELVETIPPESLNGLADFSHAEIFFVFHHDGADDAIQWTRHPRGNTAWPRAGIFAQHARRRPNRIGATIVAIRSIDGASLIVDRLDASDGTPVLDIKPVFREFLPTEPTRQPPWVAELMDDYWKSSR